MEKVLDRFLRYVKVNTQSDSTCEDKVPTTEGQWDLAKMLTAELEKMGAQDVKLSEHCIVTAKIPSNLPSGKKAPKIGFLAHMDTVDDAPGEGVNPRLVENYDGGDITLSKDGKVVMSPSVFPSLKENVGKTLVVTDGSTLLGADDKAGVAEIMTMAETLLTDKTLLHGDIRIAFSPDEEGADGIRMFDVKAFDADYAYTVDGGKVGEIEYENFNAAGFKVIVHGREVHPGEAKNKMVNAALLATEFAQMLPQSQTPATTEGYEGFYHLAEMGGDCSEAHVEYILRDHNREIFEERKAFIRSTVDYLNAKYGEGTFVLEMKDSYYNMREKVEPFMYIVDNAVSAMKEAGVDPIIVPIRGGTDGAKLSFEGLPCPNLSTGGFNFHGRYEYIPVESMESMVQVLLNLATCK